MSESASGDLFVVAQCWRRGDGERIVCLLAVSREGWVACHAELEDQRDARHMEDLDWEEVACVAQRVPAGAG